MNLHSGIVSRGFYDFKGTFMIYHGTTRDSTINSSKEGSIGRINEAKFRITVTRVGQVVRKRVIPSKSFDGVAEIKLKRRRS